jgi:hypothetical protein
MIGIVSPYEGEVDYESYLGSVEQLREIVGIYAANEIIFCGKDLSSEKIIYWMSELGPEINYKIVPEQSGSIIGSNSKDSAGDLYTIDINFRISSSIQRRNKRVLDIVISLLILLFSPLIIWFWKPFGGILVNAFSVLIGKKSWVGYNPSDPQMRNLPKLRPAVMNPIDALPYSPESPQTIHRINLFYAKDYQPANDWDIIWKALKKMGRR